MNDSLSLQLLYKVRIRLVSTTMRQFAGLNEIKQGKWSDLSPKLSDTRSDSSCTCSALVTRDTPDLLNYLPPVTSPPCSCADGLRPQLLVTVVLTVFSISSLWRSCQKSTWTTTRKFNNWRISSITDTDISDF